MSFIANLNKAQLLALIGFIAILVSIPLSLYLVKRTQTLSSKASEKKITTSTTVTKSKEVPGSSPSNELKKLLGDATASPSGTPAPTPVNLAFGPTLTLKVSLEGRPKDKQASKVFIGLALGAVTSKPSYVLSFTVDFPDTGVFNGLSLAGLNPGSTYTAYIKGPGQIDSAASFVMSPTESTLNNNQAVVLLSGDLNEDNTINTTDYSLIKGLYGSSKGTASWNERADFNQDGMVNNFDLVFVNKNMGKTGASGVWYSPAPSASSSASLNSTPATGGYWLQVP